MAVHRPTATALAALACCYALLALARSASAQEPWQDARATFYGGLDGAGTMGGACGYGNLYATGYGTLTAAASIEMWDSGAVCGTCWEVRCRPDAPASGKYCIQDATVVVTVTNQCPQGSEGGWCDRPQHHLDMAYPAWEKISNSPKAGVVETQMRRVPCPNKDGGVSFMISGNQFWTQVLVYNVGGYGDLASVEVSADSGASWMSLSRNWGTIWSGGGGLLGHSLSWKLTSIMGSEVLEIKDCIPENWYLGGTYSCTQNFPSPP